MKADTPQWLIILNQLIEQAEKDALDMIEESAWEVDYADDPKVTCSNEV